MDVSLRGAVSIARRLQDPLAELVKIDPKSIGVGQYQHDVTGSKLERSLDAVVEDAVNAVGVDVNTASRPLLARVSGITDGLAGAIVAHRDATGAFATREHLRDVPRLGPKAFEQCAGFLRIRGGDNPLDSSGVHPEAYPVVRRILEKTQEDVAALIGDTKTLRGLNPTEFTDDAFGLPTVNDILKELEKPGRDPRPEFQTATFADGVHTLGDLEPGMVLEGVVTNVAAFGAFVDIGVHQDGLVHVSALSKNFVADPHDVVKSGDVVQVKVLVGRHPPAPHLPHHAHRRPGRRRPAKPQAAPRAPPGLKVKITIIIPNGPWLHPSGNDSRRRGGPRGDADRRPRRRRTPPPTLTARSPLARPAGDGCRGGPGNDRRGAAAAVPAAGARRSAGRGGPAAPAALAVPAAPVVPVAATVPGAAARAVPASGQRGNGPGSDRPGGLRRQRCQAPTAATAARARRPTQAAPAADDRRGAPGSGGNRPGADAGHDRRGSGPGSGGNRGGGAGPALTGAAAPPARARTVVGSGDRRTPPPPTNPAMAEALRRAGLLNDAGKPANEAPADRRSGRP